MLKLPITGFAQRVPDTVARAMAILKDRRDPATKPEGKGQIQVVLRRSSPRSFR